MMEPTKPEQPSRANETDSPPGCVSEPASAKVERKRVAAAHDEPPIEEPGYGHGV